jgi:hypothetical protein
MNERRTPGVPGQIPAHFPDPNDPNAVLKFFGMLVGSMIVMKLLYSALFAAWIVAFPLAYLYAASQCPSDSSFDAKKELKRVLRGHNLPEGHPDKPQGFLNEKIARLKASVATEVATAPGYEVAIYDFIGAFKLAVVTVPIIEQDCYWVGGFSRWTYLFQRDLSVKAKAD